MCDSPLLGTEFGTVRRKNFGAARGASASIVLLELDELLPALLLYRLF
jgi:hypothetical protein